MTITLNGSDLTVTRVVAAARRGEAVTLAPAAIAAMRRARTVVQEALNQGEPAYGLTTGVGERKAFLLDPAERMRFNHRLVLTCLHPVIEQTRPFPGLAATLPADLEPLIELVTRGDLTPAA